MNKFQLKKLIKEVIREAEGMSAGRPDPEDVDYYTPEKEKEATVKLTLKGEKVTPGNIKRLLKQMVAAAAQANYETIKAEMEQEGKRGSLSNVELKSVGKDFEEEPDDAKKADIAALQGSGLNVKGGPSSKTPPPSVEPPKPAGGGTFDQEVNLANFSPEHRAEWDNPKTKPARRRELVRLSKIKPGERAGEWEKATKDDETNRIAKERMKKAAIAAGTYDPTDSKYWNDKQWDAFGHDMESGKSQKEAIHRAALYDDPTNKKYWSGIEYSIYNTAIRQERKSPQEAMNAVVRSTWNDDQKKKYNAAIAQGKSEQEAMKIGGDYMPKFGDIGAAKVRLPKPHLGTITTNI